MNKVLQCFVCAFLSTQLLAQVGIGVDDPKATLDIKAQNSVSSVDGILIPRISRDRALNMVGMENSTMVYINDITGYDASDTTSKVSNVDGTGFYFFKSSSNKWVKFPDYDQILGATYWQAQASSASPKNSKASKTAGAQDDLVTVDIFQKGKVGIGYDSNAGINFEINSTQKQLEVGGDFRAVKYNPSETLTDRFGDPKIIPPMYYGIETSSLALPQNLAIRGNVIYTAESKDLQDYSYFNKSYNGNMLIQSQDLLLFLSRTGKIDDPTGTIAHEIQSNSNGETEFIYTANTDKNLDKTIVKSFSMDAFNVTDFNDLKVRFGLSFTKSKFYIGNIDGSGKGYYFPNERGAMGQVLKLADNDGNLSWSDAGNTTASTPQFFYMPSIVLPTVHTDARVVDAANTSYTFDSVTGIYTVNLYALFDSQFKTPVVKSSATATLDSFVAANTAYDYFVTYADPNVFENILVSATGVLTYQVKTNSIIKTGSFMNIVLKVK